MNTKESLKTIRLSRSEEEVIHNYLKRNPVMRNFSALVRASLNDYFRRENLDFVNRRETPSFLWDYSLSPGQVHEILSGPREARLWLVARILEHARWKEIWEYLSAEQIASDLPYLRLSENIKSHWAYALRRWRIQ